MILPRDIKGTKRIRDAKILQLYHEKGLTQADIAKQFCLSQPRITAILNANASIILREKDWNKIKRLEVIKHQLSRAETKNVVVSPDKWVDLWRKEFESDLVVNNVTQFLQIEKSPSQNSNRLDGIESKVSSEEIKNILLPTTTNSVSPEK